MNKLLILASILLISSCGRNAFLESKKDGGRTITPGLETDECVEKTVSFSPGMANQSLHAYPFNFATTSVGVPTHIDGKTPYVKEAQTILPFDFSGINQDDFEIISMKLNYSATQLYDPTWFHESQLCHSLDYSCSGLKASVDGHLNPASPYTWKNEYFTQLVNSTIPTSHGPNCYERELAIEWDVLTNMSLVTEMLLSDLPDDYSIFIADDHYITTASLDITYCEPNL